MTRTFNLDNKQNYSFLQLFSFIWSDFRMNPGFYYLLLLKFAINGNFKWNCWVSLTVISPFSLFFFFLLALNCFACFHYLPHPCSLLLINADMIHSTIGAIITFPGANDFTIKHWPSLLAAPLIAIWHHPWVRRTEWASLRQLWACASRLIKTLLTFDKKQVIGEIMGAQEG